MAWKIPLFKIYQDEDDVKSITEAVKAGMNWAIGENVSRFEEMIAGYAKARYCTVFNSGTSALHAMFHAYGFGPGDEIIVPSFTFISTANSALFVGAKPVFADIEEDTFGLDAESVKEKITKKTKAIVPVHYAGCPCKVRELKEIAEDRGVLLLEDAAESFGAKIGDAMTGTIGDAGMLSFCQNKIITTGDGGAIVTDDRDLFEKLKLIRSHGRLESSDYFTTIDTLDYISLGYNFRMSNITAALGISQLRKVEKLIAMRRENARYMTERLKAEVGDIGLPLAPPDYYHVYQMYTVRVKDRDALSKYLADRGIMTKVYFSPVHLTHFYRNELKYDDRLPVTEKVAGDVLTLPMFPELTREDMDLIVKGIKEFYR